MLKIKKFLHVMVAFAFAFVLAIGGIGIKSAKASVNSSEEDLAEAVDEYLREKGENPGRDTIYLFDCTVVDNYNQLTVDPLCDAFVEMYTGSNRPVIAWFDKTAGDPDFWFVSSDSDAASNKEVFEDNNGSKSISDDDDYLVVLIDCDLGNVEVDSNIIPVDFFIRIPGEPPILPGPPYEETPIVQADNKAYFDASMQMVYDYPVP